MASSSGNTASGSTNQSPIWYAAIFRGGTPLVVYEKAKQHAKKAGTFAEAVATESKPDGPVSYACEGMLAQCLHRSDGSILLVVTDGSVPRRVPYVFLQDVEEGLKDDPRAAGAVLERTANSFRADDALSRTKKDLSEVRTVIVDSIDRLLERGERINLLVDRTHDMDTSAGLFRRQATGVRRRFWWKNVRLIIIAAVMVLALLALVWSQL